MVTAIKHSSYAHRCVCHSKPRTKNAPSCQREEEMELFAGRMIITEKMHAVNQLLLSHEQSTGGLICQECYFAFIIVPI